MRIISKFHDYYDTAMVHGHDDSVLFKRESPDLTEAEANRLLSLYSPFIYFYNQRVTTKRNEVYELNALNVFFCGKAYYGIAFEPGYLAPSLPTVYDMEHLLACGESVGFEIKAEGSSKQRKWQWRGYPWRANTHAYAKRYFDDAASYNQSALAKVMVNERHSIISVETVNRRRIITVNPQLKQHHFFKALPPYQAFQELDMWHSGVMAEDPAMRMVQIEDKYRIPQHGFDKWSFRKQGEKSK